MDIYMFGISHESAPLEVRERLSFTQKKQQRLLQFITENIANEAVIVSTCNRCEFYLAGDVNEYEFKEYLEELSGGSLSEYLTVLKNDECAQHLMLTATGLKSMILGEDQILGQVKDAHEKSRQGGFCSVYLNTLFRIAVTAAKRVKTDTLLSKTSVSAATISVKLCRNLLGSSENKKALVIGASGKTGSIIARDLVSLADVDVYITSRNHNALGTINTIDGTTVIPYEDRYEALDVFDAVFSASSSPHLTIEKERAKNALKTRKKRVFMDLAMPRDISVYEDELTICKNIDNLREIAEQNSALKLGEIGAAKEIIKKYKDEFCIWKLFYDNRALFEASEKKIENTRGKDIFRRNIYRLKSENNYTKFKDFIIGLKEGLYEY